MAASVSFTYGLQGKDSKIREHLEAIQTLISGLDAGTTDFSTLKIAGALTNTGKLLTDADGNVTMPAQPAFQAIRFPFSPPTVDTTGASPYILASEVYDTGGDYNLDTGLFTAPKDGVYFFSAYLGGANKSGSLPTNVQITIITSSLASVTTYDNPWGTGVAGEYHTATVSGVFVMDQNDTAYMGVSMSSGTISVNRAGFSGMLIG